jgi:hypothetical protein
MSDPTPPSSLKRKIIFALLTAFVCGAAAGGGAVWLGARRGVPAFPAGPHRHGPGGDRPRERPEDMPVRIADRLWKDLDLEEKLREPIRQIFRDGFAETEPIRKHCGEEMKAVFARQNDRVKALLTPEQQTRFDALIAEWDKHHGSPGHRPPGSKPPDGKRRPPPGGPGPRPSGGT